MTGSIMAVKESTIYDVHFPHRHTPHASARPSRIAKRIKSALAVMPSFFIMRD